MISQYIFPMMLFVFAHAPWFRASFGMITNRVEYLLAGVCSLSRSAMGCEIMILRIWLLYFAASVIRVINLFS